MCNLLGHHIACSAGIFLLFTSYRYWLVIATSQASSRMMLAWSKCYCSPNTSVLQASHHNKITNHLLGITDDSIVFVVRIVWSSGWGLFWKELLLLPHPDDHTIPTTDTPGFKPFTNIVFVLCREERKWRKWVDNTFVHTLSPNIYRTASEAMQAFEYFTKESNFGTVEKYTTYLAGPLVMYFVGKHVKNK